ncbi:MAG: DUF177 domain-containing protein [Anaerolineae bacterium]|nr:DUF177 domain-containing protein [Anaerolineae bacterium]
MIRINLSTLVHAKIGQHQSIILNLDAVSTTELDLRYLKGELHFTRVRYGVLVEGLLETEVQTECTRCLTPFYEPVTIELGDIVSLPGAELTPECPVRISEDGWADLLPLIREYVWISIPVNAICSPECKGICQECGGNLNLGMCTCDNSLPIDPRWDALRMLLDSSDN